MAFSKYIVDITGDRDEIIINDDFSLTESYKTQEDEPSHISDSDKEDSYKDSLEFLTSMETDQFNETFGEVNELMLKHKEIIRENKDQQQKLYDLTKELDYFQKEKDNPTLLYTDEAARYRRKCYKYYEATVKNGFYTGFLSQWRCQLCDEILGMHPSTYKRIYWVPKEDCIYCKGTHKRLEIKDTLHLREDANKWKRKKKKYMFRPFHHFIMQKTTKAVWLDSKK